MLGAWRTLKPGGMFFSRLGSTIGGELLLRHISGRWHLMADGTERYLVDEPLLMQWTAELGAELVNPIKTTVVQNLRSLAKAKKTSCHISRHSRIIGARFT
jgi:hypothetical protein